MGDNLKYVTFKNISSNIVDKNSNILLDVSNNRLDINDISTNIINILNLQVPSLSDNDISNNNYQKNTDKLGDIKYHISANEIVNIYICIFGGIGSTPGIWKKITTTF